MKFLSKLKCLIPSKRRIIQLYAALLFNANLKGFINGKIYQGPVKNICTPGLNCYSCPGATGACPLGSLQNSLLSKDKSFIYYTVGIVLLYCIIFGRTICGFLCPFGLIQDLLHKIKTPKLPKNRVTKALSWLKYVILVLFVGVIPVMYGLHEASIPGFCKYICPAGIIEGAFGLLSNSLNFPELARLGPLFTWKFLLTVSIVVGCVFIYRMFCRFICPLGALYGLFNRFSVLGVKVDKPSCTDCGLCISKCKMDISRVGDHECIQCGECISVCPTKAISFKGGKIFLPPNEIPDIKPEMNEEEKALEIAKTEAKNKKLKTRRLVSKIVSLTLAVSLLIGALVYFNFIDKPVVTDKVYTVGEACPDVDIPIFDGNDYSKESFNPLDNKGKVTVINFWHTSCQGCKEELPHFDKIASDLKDMVTVVAVSKAFYEEPSYDYINTNYPSSEIKWGLDTPIADNTASGSDKLFTSLGGKDAYPITIIIDPNGNINRILLEELEYGQLFAYVMAAKAAAN